MAAYSLTDCPVIDALIGAHRRGLAVRSVLDPSHQHALDRLREITGRIRKGAFGSLLLPQISHTLQLSNSLKLMWVVDVPPFSTLSTRLTSSEGSL